jgi:hypothetical protein
MIDHTDRLPQCLGGRPSVWRCTGRAPRRSARDRRRWWRRPVAAALALAAIALVRVGPLALVPAVAAALVADGEDGGCLAARAARRRSHAGGVKRRECAPARLRVEQAHDGATLARTSSENRRRLRGRTTGPARTARTRSISTATATHGTAPRKELYVSLSRLTAPRPYWVSLERLTYDAHEANVGTVTFSHLPTGQRSAGVNLQHGIMARGRLCVMAVVPAASRKDSRPRFRNPPSPFPQSSSKVVRRTQPRIGTR